MPASSQIMPETIHTICGLMDVDSLIVYVNDKSPIKSQRHNLREVGEFARFCKYAGDIILALTAPQLGEYLICEPEYVPPKKTMLRLPMHESLGKFEIRVNNPVDFLKYLETQEHPLDILYGVIKDACDGNLQSLSFELERQLVPYDTGMPASYEE